MKIWVARAVAGACTSTLIVTGCMHPVSLVDLREISDTSELPEYRHIGLVDRIRESDVIEFSVNDGEEECWIQIVERCNSASDNCPYPDNQDLTAPAQRARTTAFVLAIAENIRIAFPTQTSEKCKAETADATLPTEGLLGSDWNAIKVTLERKFTAPELNLTVSRSKQYERRMLPGDEVRITAEYMVSGEYGAQPYTFTDAVSKVQPDGNLAISPLFYPTAPPSSSPRYADIGRAFGQQAVSARIRIPVWRAGAGYAAQPTVAQVERCLASMWGEAADDWDLMPASLKAEREGCRGLGIDNLTFGGETDNAFIRYRLEVRQYWTAALWDGRLLQIPFVPGETVDHGVRRALRVATGRDMFPDWAVYVTVDPRSEFGDPPFYASVNRDTVLESVLIAPGDVIHVSNHRPEIRRAA